MQTFLPYEDFDKSAQVLDFKRLNKQALECTQLIDSIVGFSSGWRNHPACKMWENHPWVLLKYLESILKELSLRRGSVSYGHQLGYRSNIEMLEKKNFPKDVGMPSWLGSEEFHLSHRLNLLYKDPVYYSGFFKHLKVPKVKPEYVWPIHQEKGVRRV